MGIQERQRRKDFFGGDFYFGTYTKPHPASGRFLKCLGSAKKDQLKNGNDLAQTGKLHFTRVSIHFKFRGLVLAQQSF